MKLMPYVLAARLLWTPNTEPDLSHYIVFSGSQSGTYDAYQITSDTTFSPLENGRFYAVKAVDQAGNVSDFSEEVKYEEAAMNDTLLIADSLYFVVSFTEGIIPPNEQIFIEHRFSSATFQGQWLPLLLENGDYIRTILPEDRLKITINIPRLRSFIGDPTIFWFVQFRARTNTQTTWITHEEILSLEIVLPAPRSIKSLTPFKP